MHPAHVPFVGEAEAAEVHRAADAGKRGRFLGRGHRARMLAVGQAVQLLEKADRLEVLAAAVLVRHPLPLLARVVEVQHRRHRIHAKTVDVVLLEPEQRVREQKVPDLVAAVVEDQRAPVLVLALARILVLEQRGAVEARQAVRVLRKMSRHPVEDHAEPRLVAGIHEQLEILGRTEARGRREEAEHLVAPRPRERMLHHRQQLDVGEAHLLDVRHQPVRHLAVGQEAVAFLRHARPRSEVHLVGGHRPVEPRALRRPRGHPVAVAPVVARDVVHDRRGLRRRLERARERIGLLQDRAVAGADLELVLLAVGEIRNEDLPDAGGQEAHRRDAAVPAVEVADHADAIRVGRPHREMHAGGRALRDAVRAELLERAVVGALAEQVQIEIGQHAAVAIRIVELDLLIAGVGDPQAIVRQIPARPARPARA